MINLNIFKALIFVLLFSSCKSKIIENKYDNKYADLDEMSKAVRKIINKKKTGVFVFPKVGYVLSLKKGRLDGEMSLIRKQDTIYYCVYKNNKPTGKYINYIFHRDHSYGSIYNMYYNYLLIIQSAVTDSGTGFYNKNNKKEGFWDESGYCLTEEGTYENGLKHGIWVEDCFNDGGAFYTTRIIKYNKGVVVRRSVKFSDSSIDWSQGK